MLTNHFRQSVKLLELLLYQDQSLEELVDHILTSSLCNHSRICGIFLKTRFFKISDTKLVEVMEISFRLNEFDKVVSTTAACLIKWEHMFLKGVCNFLNAVVVSYCKHKLNMSILFLRNNITKVFCFISYCNRINLSLVTLTNCN